MADPSTETESSNVQGPPNPPTPRRRFYLRPGHAPLLSVLLLITILAAVGFFGETRTTTKTQSASLGLNIDYPTRFRYKQINPMRIRVRNRTRQSMDTVTVAIDSTYIDPFSNVTFTPSAARPWVVELTDLKPGEHRRIHVTLQAETYGRHRGAVSALHGSDTARAEVSTFIFP